MSSEQLYLAVFNIFVLRRNQNFVRIVKATSLELHLEEEQIVVDIDAQTRDLRDNVQVNIKETAYLGVSLYANKIDFIISKDPFGYF